MPLKLNSTGGGSITLQEPSTASNRTLTLPDNTGNLISSADSGTVSQTMLASGVAGNGPAFRAYRTTNQSISVGVVTKVSFEAEEFDTAGNFDLATSRFTPNVAGYYQIFGLIYHSATGTRPFEVDTFIYKNGSNVAMNFLNVATNIITMGCGLSRLIYMNGTTDYLELYGFSTGSVGPVFIGGSQYTYFEGFLARAA